ncbi:lipid asymmetry maintenance ABC transporter permease subunit MlaE [Thiomicrospira microaerophila]|uniref:lipid asymmetry maintenance ABC transporter permease subunit MlaE n=1 Tax=Thiomicrospira microaerophila TaxID=406020 RepID=UPI0005C8B153|nr:lipid asymmetry maintenance ABC transporter permease subunit MlaE [Thiomicrospira microaerophila]
MNGLAKLGRASLWRLQSLGQLALFVFSVFPALGYAFVHFRLVIKQVYGVGVLSLPIILTAGLFVGMVLALQGHYILSTFNSEEIVGSMTALSLIRELGPVVAALLFAGRAGSALTAEVGLMKSTEQLSALEMMAIDPIKYVVAPRILACVIALPMLALIFIAIGVFGGYLVAVGWLGVDEGAFWAQMQLHVDWHDDVLNGLLKAIVFAFVIAIISLFQGYEAMPTSEGVSNATTRTVVQSSLWVLGLDFVLTSIMFT